MRIGRFSIFFILSLAGLLFAQNSLWQDSNPYTENKTTGDVIRLQIEDRFILETDDTQDGSNR
ncbi:MAG: hypothetical protein KDK38_03025, partial [Leptospiraceae bacterium]|nr:hypothetical protein [Leptospiraceae bacterium]